MKNINKIVYGIFLTAVIFLTAIIIGNKILLHNKFFTNTFMTHTVMLLLSILLIILMRKNLSYRISLPKFKNVIKPIVIGIVITILINILMSIITKLVGGKIEVHPLLSKMNPLQAFIFIFIYASIAEEMLFRGFLMNFLKSLTLNGITFFKRKISFPIIISALAFGLAHLILIRTGVGSLFLVRIVLFATCLGLIAGYYQEKYDNNSYAIIVHMSANLLGVIGVLLLNF